MWVATLYIPWKRDGGNWNRREEYFGFRPLLRETILQTTLEKSLFLSCFFFFVSRIAANHVALPRVLSLSLPPRSKNTTTTTTVEHTRVTRACTSTWIYLLIFCFLSFSCYVFPFLLFILSFLLAHLRSAHFSFSKHFAMEFLTRKFRFLSDFASYLEHLVSVLFVHVFFECVCCCCVVNFTITLKFRH